MLDSTDVSVVRIFAGAGDVTDLTEMSTFAELLRDVRRTSLVTGRCLLFLVQLTLQMHPVSLVGQFIHSRAIVSNKRENGFRKSKIFKNRFRLKTFLHLPQIKTFKFMANCSCLKITPNWLIKNFGPLFIKT